MNLDELGLHEGLLRALKAREPDTLYPFLEKTVGHVNRKRESISAQVRMGSGREYLYLVPLLEWLLTEEPEGRALVVLPSDQDVAAAKGRADALAEDAGSPVHAVGHDPDPADSGSRLSMGAASVLAARQEEGSLDLQGYGFLVVDGAERFVESPYHGHILKLKNYLRPPRERRTILFSEKLGVKEQTLALELTDAPQELYLEEEAEKAKRVPQATWYVATDSKVRLLLGVLARDAPGPAAVFCNLRESVEELVRRLSANGLRTDIIQDNHPLSRKEAVLARAKAGELDAVILTDEGAKGLPTGSLRFVVNYDIPLEGEPYLSRIRFLDAAAPGARVVNFACDRYVYGIPAVEQFMGISLGAVQADESLFAASDKSAGMTQNRGGRNHGDRPQGRGRDDRSSRGGGGDRRPGGQGYGSQRRNDGDRRRDGRGREGDLRNQESIRAGIAELTGVNLGGSGARSRSPEGQPEAGGAQGRGPRPEGSGRSRRNKHGRKAPSAGGGAYGKGAVSQPSFTDPYALPMEERMRLYKEKYGKHLAENPAPKNPGRRKGRRRRGKPSGAPGAEGAGGARRAESSPGPGAAPGGPSVAPDARGPGSPSGGAPGDGGEGRNGILGRLFGAPRKDDQE